MRNASSPQPSRMSCLPLSPAMDRLLSATVQDQKCTYSVATSAHEATDPCGMDAVDGEDSQVGNNVEWANCDEEQAENQVTPKYHPRYSQLQ